MADEDQPHAAPPHLLVDDLEDAVLNRYVERGGSLVSDQHVRLPCHHHGDHNPLRHAAGELVRIEPAHALWIADVDIVEQLQHAFLRDRREEALAGAARRCPIRDMQAREPLYPHEVSGGMAQRVMIAMMMARGPQERADR